MVGPLGKEEDDDNKASWYVLGIFPLYCAGMGTLVFPVTAICKLLNNPITTEDSIIAKNKNPSA